jgi:betaine-aldehyde dehydrogenase
MTSLVAERQLFIGNHWRDSSDGGVISIVQPASGTTMGTVASATRDDVDMAVSAAHRAFADWSQSASETRAHALDAIADHLEGRRAELVERTARNNGKPIAEAEADLDDAVACYRYYGRLAADGLPTVPVEAPAGCSVRKERLPLGVAALIVPWNFPLTTAAWKVAPALAAGCTVVLKASEVTPFAELALGSAALAAKLPEGVVNIVVGGPECGAHLTQHALVGKISFTGSNTVGERVMRAAAERAVPVTLELGGKSPIIVCADVDLDWAADIVAGSIFTNCGQVCSATSRLVVEADIAEALHSRLVARAEALVMGDPLDRSTTLGPLTSAAQLAKVEQYFAIAAEERLRRLTGGTRVSGPGQFVTPTIYADVPPTSRLWREEIFGPVLVTARFSFTAEALALAQDTSFGLGATVLCGDGERAARMAAALRAGNVWVNTGQVVFPGGSWGGFGASGFGRELGLAGLEAFTSVRQTLAPSQWTAPRPSSRP